MMMNTRALATVVLVALCSARASASKEPQTCRDITTKTECIGTELAGYECKWSCSSALSRGPSCACLQGEAINISDDALDESIMAEWVSESTEVLRNATTFEDIADIEGNGSSDNNFASVDASISTADEVAKETIEANLMPEGDSDTNSDNFSSLDSVRSDDDTRNEEVDTVETDKLKLPSTLLPFLKDVTSPFKVLMKIDPLKKYIGILEKLDKLFDATGPIAMEIKKMETLKKFLVKIDNSFSLGDPVDLYTAALRTFKKFSPLKLKIGALQKLHELVIKKPKDNKKLSGLALFAFRALKTTLFKALVLNVGESFLPIEDLKSKPLEKLVDSIPDVLNPLDALGFLDNLGKFKPLRELLKLLGIPTIDDLLSLGEK